MHKLLLYLGEGSLKEGKIRWQSMTPWQKKALLKAYNDIKCLATIPKES